MKFLILLTLLVLPSTYSLSELDGINSASYHYKAGLKASTTADPDMDTVYNRLFSFYLGDVLGSPCSSTCTNAINYQKSLQSDGSWADVNYQDQNTAVWAAATHWTRLDTMSRAYNCINCNASAYHNSTMVTSMNSAIDYWLKNDFQNPNWWYNDIGIPQDLVECYILIRPFLTAYELQQAQVILNRANYSTWTGENLVWGLQIQIARGLIYNDTNLVTQGFSLLWNSTVYSNYPNDGVLHDGSFYQHGALLASGSYGNGYSYDLLEEGNLADGTRFAMTSSALDVLASNVLDGQQYMIRSWSLSSGPITHWDVTPKGREITRSPGSQNFDSTSWAYFMQSLSGPRSQEFKNFALRLQKGPNTTTWVIGNKHYWKNDYHVHHRQAFFTALRMFSSRTYNAECVNNEGLQSWHLADSVTTFYQRGDEYVGIFPCWDWNKLPGITSRQGTKETTCSTVKQYGGDPFVGGLSDGMVGLSVQKFKSNNFGGTNESTVPLYAAKSYFFIDEGMIALGSNITLGVNLSVLTTINQCLLKSDVYVDGQSGVITKGTHTYTTAKWVHHDGIGYISLATNAPTFHVGNTQQNGTWYSINLAYSNATVSLDIFSLSIDHTSQPKNQSYAYAVIPGVAATNMATVVGQISKAVTIISNNENIQAIFYLNSQGIKSLLASFYQAGTINGGTGWSVQVNHPVLLMIHDFSTTNKTLQIWASNPTNAALNVTVTIDRTIVCATTTKSKIEKIIMNDDDDRLVLATTVTLTLPTGEMAGSSHGVNCTVQ